LLSDFPKLIKGITDVIVFAGKAFLKRTDNRPFCTDYSKIFKNHVTGQKARAPVYENAV
jgi:hypothetical protein